jgi:hypothetical protein
VNSQNQVHHCKWVTFQNTCKRACRLFQQPEDLGCEGGKNLMVRKGGLEPPCLSAPPPQDGVSANFTTSAHWWRKAEISIAGGQLWFAGKRHHDSVTRSFF